MRLINWWRQARAMSGSSMDFMVLLADRLLRLPVGLLLAGAMARCLGAEAYGWMSSGLALLTIGSTVAQLGLDLVVVRRAAQNPERAGGIMGAAFIARVLAGGLTMALFWALLIPMGYDDPEERQVALILAFGLLVPALSVPGLWFQSRTRSRTAVWAALGVFVVMALVRAGMILMNAGVVAFAWLVLVESFGTALVVWAAMRRAGGELALAAGMKEIAGLLRGARPLLVGALASTLYMKMDLIILRWLVGAEAAGLYAAGTRLSEFAYGIPALLGMSVMAGLSQSAGEGGLDQRVDAYLRASTALGYMLSVPVVVLAPWLIPVIFGPQYADASLVAQIHIISVFFLCLTLARGRVLVAQGFVHFTMVSALVGAVFGLLLNLALVPVFGMVGAAAATVGAHAFSGLGLTLIYKPTRPLGVRLLRAIIRPQACDLV